ncbi:MAG TPA: hypothetical protein DCE52_18950 [Rhodobacteraceae bacterium]|nr:hypothetical protein [Paracoccaceae bacterium]
MNQAHLAQKKRIADCESTAFKQNKFYHNYAAVWMLKHRVISVKIINMFKFGAIWADLEPIYRIYGFRE